MFTWLQLHLRARNLIQETLISMENSLDATCVCETRKQVAVSSTDGVKDRSVGAINKCTGTSGTCLSSHDRISKNRTEFVVPMRNPSSSNGSSKRLGNQTTDISAVCSGKINGHSHTKGDITDGEIVLENIRPSTSCRASPGSPVVEGLPPRRSGELPRGSSSSSSGDSPISEISRPLRKSGEVSRVSISSGASFSGEIPRVSGYSCGDILEGFRPQRRSGELPRGSNSSCGSSNGESPTVDVLRASQRRTPENYHAGNLSSNGSSPTPEVFHNRAGKKTGDAPHFSNSSGGSSDGGSPTAESMWGSKTGAGAAVPANCGMVTGGSFSSFNTVSNGNIGDNHLSGTSKKPATINPPPSTPAAPKEVGSTSRFMVGVTPLVGSRGGITASVSSNLGKNDTKKSTEGRLNLSDRKSAPALNPEDVKNAGNAEYKKGNFSQALLLYDRAISLCPEQASYRCNRAAALAGLGRLAEASQECEISVKLDPSYCRAHQRLASLHIRLGQFEEARKHLKAGQQWDIGDSQRVNMVEKRFLNCLEAKQAKDWDRMIKESDAAIVAGADCALEVFSLKAEALLKLQRLDEADAVIGAARRLEEGGVRSPSFSVSNNLLVLRAQIDMAQGRFEDAVTVAERAVRADSRNVETTHLLRKARIVAKSRAAGNDLFKAAKYFESCAAYTEGLEMDSMNAVLLCNRAASRSKLGQWEKALEDSNAALTIQPTYTKALLRRAHSYAKLERWEDAVRDYEAIRREHPGDVEVAQALFDVQVALNKSRGEEICKTRFGGKVEEVTRNDQFREAISSPGLWVVEFTTRWSDRCRQFSVFVEDLCKRYSSISFSKVDVDDSPYLAQLESINSVPTFKIFRNGVKVRELLGPSQQGLEQAVKQCGLT